MSASGLLLCVETDGVSIWFIVVCGDRCCQHLVYCCVWRQMHNNKPNADTICLHTQQ